MNIKANSWHYKYWKFIVKLNYYTGPFTHWSNTFFEYPSNLVDYIISILARTFFTIFTLFLIFFMFWVHWVSGVTILFVCIWWSSYIDDRITEYNHKNIQKSFVIPKIDIKE